MDILAQSPCLVKVFFQIPILSVSAPTSFHTHTHTHRPQQIRLFPPGSLSGRKFLFAMKINFGKRHSKGLWFFFFFPGCPKIDLVHRMPQIIAFGNFILLMIYFLYDQYDKCAQEQSGPQPDAAEVRTRGERWAAALCVL